VILIPEIRTVVILVPRTGSGALRRAIAAKYPKSMLVYRHMEADGVPQGYDRWEKVGVARHPIDRLWSLYKFLQRFDGAHDPAYIAAMRGSVTAPFSEWLATNEVVFTSPYDRAGLGRFFPEFTVRHPLPENRKSQFLYLRPDLGTTIYRYDQVRQLHAHLHVNPCDNVNATGANARPALTPAAEEYVRRCFSWDLEVTTP
jgi:hypothetical protein